MPQFDVFISYRHRRKAEVVALCGQLDLTGLSYFRDEQRRDDDDSIQRTIEQGLARSKLLLAWFDPTYLQSKACAWELSRALLAAQAGGGGLQRIVCVDPSRSFSHIVPEALADQAQLVSLDDPSALIRLLRERAASFAEPLGALVSGNTPGWYERERPTHPTWVGRAGELIRLFHQLDRGRLAMHGGERAPVALTGWGGEGKTMLAEQYALRFAAAYPGGVVWLSGATEDGVTPRAGEWQQQLESALVAAAAGKLGLPVSELVKGMPEPLQRIRTLKEAIDRALRSRANPDAPPPIAPYLWIVDDLPDRLSAQEQRLWLPPSEQAHCIATLRQGGGIDAVFHVLPVRQLHETEALQLLARRRKPQPGEEEAIARQIVEAVDRLPLALELGAALVETLGYRAYLDVLQAPGNAALEKLVASLGAALPTGHESSIVKTFLRSLDQLPGADDDKHPTPEQHANWIVLRLAALLAPEPLPDAFAQRVLRAFGLANADATLQCQIALTTLHRAAVITRDADNEPDASRTHALIARTVVEARLSDGQRSILFAKAVEAALAWVHDEMLRPPIEGDRRLLAATIRLAAQTSSLEAASLSHKVAEFAERMGQLPEARSLHERSRALCISLLGEEHPDTLTSMNNLAATMQAQGDLPGARALQEHVLALRRRLLGEEHPETLTSMGNLATMMQAQGDLPGARALHEQVLALSRELLGKEHPDTLASMGNLASMMQAQGDLPGARALQEQVLALCQRLLGEEHPYALTATDYLASTMRDQGDLPGARVLQEQVLVLRHRLLGEEHPDTLTSMGSLASTMRAQGELLGARALQDQVLALHRRLLGEEHPNTLTWINNLASTMRAQGELLGARALQDQVLVLRRRLLGEEHPETLTSMNNLALTMQDQGDLPGARALHEQVLALRRRLLGKDHPNTLISMNNLASTMRAQGELLGARALQEQVLTLRRRLLGQEHPDTLSSMNNLALTMQAQGDLPGTRTLQEQVLALYRRLLGEEHPDTLTSMNNLAVTMQAQGDLTAARALQDQVLALHRRLLGEEHPHTDSSTWNLYETLLELQDLQAAERLENHVEALWMQRGQTGDALKPLHEHIDACRAAHGLPPRGTDPGGNFNSAAPP